MNLKNNFKSFPIVSMEAYVSQGETNLGHMGMVGRIYVVVIRHCYILNI